MNRSIVQKSQSFKLNVTIKLGILLLALPSVSYAYLDPGTGSIILQGVIAAIAGALVTIKLYWNKIKTMISRLFGANRKDS